MAGKHSYRAGVDVNWAQRNSKTDSNGRGTFTFTGYATILLTNRDVRFREPAMTLRTSC